MTRIERIIHGFFIRILASPTIGFSRVSLMDNYFTNFKSQVINPNPDLISATWRTLRAVSLRPLRLPAAGMAACQRWYSFSDS